jgi:hypothetical protein
MILWFYGRSNKRVCRDSYFADSSLYNSICTSIK